MDSTRRTECLISSDLLSQDLVETLRRAALQAEEGGHQALAAELDTWRRRIVAAIATCDGPGVMGAGPEFWLG